MSETQSRYGRVPEMCPSPGFDPLIIRLVASRYTDWATAAHDYRKVEHVITLFPDTAIWNIITQSGIVTNYLTSEKLTVAQLVKKFPAFMESEVSLPRSKEPIICH
jgi:hypothetical protein